MEEARGYESAGELWSPGYFRVWLEPAAGATLIASTEPWEAIQALSPDGALTAEQRTAGAAAARGTRGRARGHAGGARARRRPVRHQPAGRVEDAARAQAAGDEVRTVIAGYHWFTDWGRDTMISLEGLTLRRAATSRRATSCARSRTTCATASFPTCSPRARTKACITPPTRRCGTSTPSSVPRHHRRSRDPRDCCCPSSATSSITMSAARASASASIPSTGCCGRAPRAISSRGWTRRSDDWVVTPRRGKAVEINALWYNALRLLEGWLRDEHGDDAAQPIAERADRVRTSFNAPFLVRARRVSLRRRGWRVGRRRGVPSQPVASRSRWTIRCSTSRAGRRSSKRPAPAADARRPAVARARASGLQAVVLRRPAHARRGLSPGHGLGLVDRPDGGRVAARVPERPRRRQAPARGVHRAISAKRASGRSARSSMPRSRITPRGCVAQAWSVAEVLRCWLKSS